MDCFLIDGFNLGFRCFYAMPDLSRSDGFPTGALHAFFQSLLRLAALDAPHAGAVFFDKGGSIRHREIYPEYKANRVETPENFKRQLPAIRDLCELFGMENVMQEGVEADDLLASTVEKLKPLGGVITIVSADKDFAQLICPKVRQLLPPNSREKNWTPLDAIGVKAKFGVSPAQIPAYLAIIGDSADNINGIFGVGPKTAAKWLKDFGDIETIIRRYDWLKPEKFRTVIKENEGLLRRNLELITLKTDYEVELPEKKNPNFPELIKFLEEMEMKKSIVNLRKFAKDHYSWDA